MSTSIDAARLLVASAGNDFMIEIGRILCEGFAGCGLAAELAIDGVPLGKPGTLEIAIAPHEYFPLFYDGLSPGARGAGVAALQLLNVEQPGSQWFELSMRRAHEAAGVLEISPVALAELERRGIAARYMPLGAAPCLVAQRPGPREIDVIFFGWLSERRQRYFARHARFFGEHNCYLSFFRAYRPVSEGTPGYFAGEARNALIASAKILINVHAVEGRRYCESQRLLVPLANGCLVISETMDAIAPLEPGKHLVVAGAEAIPGLCRHYLAHEEERRAMAEAGRELVNGALSARTICGRLLDELRGEVAATASPLPTVAEAPSAIGRRVAQRVAALERSSAWAAAGEPRWTLAANDAYEAERAAPSVSVVVPLFNYGHYLTECLESVAASDPTALPAGLELIVVDDASTDGSAALAEALVRRLALPAVLVRKRLNTGVSDTRNAGLELARAPYVYFLDADNHVEPHCLGTLREAISAAAGDEGRWAAAYGFAARFDDRTGASLGLLSAYAWDPRELVREPYLDAMALFDRELLRELGGFATEPMAGELIDGWEDYELWLRLASAGHRCRLVPRVVSAYRDHEGSQIRRENEKLQRLARHFRDERFAELVARYDDLDRTFGLIVGESPSPEDFARGGARAPGEPGSCCLRCEGLDRRIEGLYASRSWRWMAPMRWAFRKLTGAPS